jgi:hypothetical protein
LSKNKKISRQESGWKSFVKEKSLSSNSEEEGIACRK